MNHIETPALNVSDVLKMAHLEGVQFSVSDGNLRIKMSKTGISDLLLNNIKQLKPEILKAIEGAQSGQTAVTTALEHKKNKTETPLTKLQESMWLAEKLSDANGLLNYCCVSHIVGQVSLPAMEFAYKKVIERHIPLRSQFFEKSIGKTYQSPFEDYTVTLEYLELDATEFEVFMRKCASRAFNFKRDLLLQLHLVKLSENEYKLILVTHHLVTDGWSIGILIEEIGHFYNQYLGNNEAEIPELEIDYYDYANWIFKENANGAEEPGLNYWKNRLKDAPVIHGVPHDIARPSALSFGVRYYYSYIRQPDIQPISDFAKNNRLTLYVVTLAAYIVLLNKYSGENRFVIGTSVANRPKESLFPIVGLFTNNLPMLFDYEPEQSFSQFVNAVQKKYLADMEHQGVQLDRIIKELSHDAMNLSYSPLIQISFYLQNNEISELELKNAKCQTTEVKTNVSLYDLSLSITENNDNLELEWIYSKDLFVESTVRRMASQYEKLLKQLIANPDLPLNSTQLLENTESKLILNEFSRNEHLSKQVRDEIASFSGKPALVHSYFERKVEEQANKTALVYDDVSLSYSELNSRANKLARILVDMFDSSENKIVGVGLEKSLELVISLLAIMKAGGTYLPLDPAFPKARLEYMQENSNVSIVITMSNMLENTSIDRSRVLLLDNSEFMSLVESQDNADLNLAILPEHLVYILYTSGSTGKPKGVMIEHSNLLLFLLSMQREPSMNQSDNILAVSSISFDIHTLEIFLPLICGATVVMVNPVDYADPQRLIGHLSKQNISIMQATPSAWKMLLDANWEPETPIRVLCGGEALDDKLKDKLLTNNNIELWNMYGPTEASVWCSVKKVEKEVTLGRPTAGTSLYVLDENLNIVPIGVRGQLYIGGQVLARGYVNNQLLTDEAFIRDLPAHIEEERIYKTGDFVKWTEDGELIYLGRKDSQIKIRGFRIEPQEIVKVINSFTYIKESVVVTKTDVNQEKILAAYVVASLEDENIVDKLREDISAILPEYMVPSTIEHLPELPLTPNGKIDSEKLKRRKVVVPVRKKVFPSTPRQKVLAEIWADILSLKQEEIGIYDNFYALGGNSMSGMVFIGRAKSKGLSLKATDLLKYPTISQLENVCVDYDMEFDSEIFSGEAALTIDQKSVLYLPVAREKYFINIIFDLNNSYDVGILEKAMDRVSEVHESLRATFRQIESGEWKQYIQSSIDATEILQYSVNTDLNEDEVNSRFAEILSHLHKKMNIEAGPLMAAALITDNNSKQKLVFSISHLICDGFSVPIVIEDIFSCYRQMSQGNERVMLPVYTPIQQWSREYDKFVNSNALQSQIEYWESLNWSKLRKYPLDYPQNEHQNTVRSIRTISVDLDLEHTAIFLSSSLHEMGIDQMELLVHVLVSVLTRWTNGEAVFLNVFDTGRSMVPELYENYDLSRTLASFAIARCLFLENEKSSNLTEALLATKKQMDKVPMRGFSYRVLFHSEENKNLCNRMKKLPVPELWFNYYGVSDSIKSENGDLPPISKLVKHIEPVSMLPDAPRNRTLFLPWQVVGGKLNMIWEYSDNLHKQISVKALAEAYKKELAQTLDLIANSVVQENKEAHETEGSF